MTNIQRRELLTDENKWRPMLNSLLMALRRCPNSREKRMMELHLKELFYHFWHYKLGPGYTCTNVDFVEYDPGYGDPQIIAIIETKTQQTAPHDTQRKVLLKIANALSVPLYQVTTDEQCKMFLVERLDRAEPSLTLTEPEFKDWHKKLRRATK